MPVAHSLLQEFSRIAAAYVRGMLLSPDHPLFRKPVMDLTEEEIHELILTGRQHRLRMASFEPFPPPPAHARCLAILRSINPDSIAEIGCAHGSMMWHLLQEYKSISLTATDLHPHKLDRLRAVRKGGFANLTPVAGDALHLSQFSTRMHDVVLALDLLEYLPDPAKALEEWHRIAKRFVLVSVSTIPDQNPAKKHFHSFEDWQQLFRKSPFLHLHGEKTGNHWLWILRK